MGKRQHHKGLKRPRHWHRGKGEARRWAHLRLPDLETGADPTGQPVANHLQRRTGKQQRGDAL